MKTWLVTIVVRDSVKLDPSVSRTVDYVELTAEGENDAKRKALTIFEHHMRYKPAFRQMVYGLYGRDMHNLYASEAVEL